VQEPELHDQPGNAIANGDFDEGMLGWSAENLGGAAAEGYAVHENGELHVLIQKITGAENAQYMVRLKQQVTLQANQNYRIRLRARAAEPRLLRVFVGQRDEPYETYLQMDDDPETEGDGIHLTTEMQTFEVVQAAATASSGFVQLALDFADSTAEVVLDDIVLAPTSDPETAPGAVVAPPTQDPGAPTTPPPGTPPGSSPPAPAGSNNGTIGTVTPSGDNTGSTPGATIGAPNPIDATAGMPPAPVGAPSSNTCSATTPTVCGQGYLCSVQLGLCYDPATGYVRDPATNNWALPPLGYPGCGPDQAFWPKYNTCYVPDTGFIWNTQLNRWEFYGIDYTEGKDFESADSGCDLSGSTGSRSGSSWMLVGLLGAALGLSYRRRAA
jgi:hypothetical protein